MNANVFTPLRNHSGSRREFLGKLGLASAFFAVPGVFAEQLTRKTPWVEEGPFYPPKLPLDTDNDLIIVNDSITPAIGEITHLSGRLLDTRGEPMRDATIEIWSVDNRGIYLADSSNRERYDSHFQGFGRFLTGSTGEYYFRTLKPVAYPGRRAPHIHFKIKMKGREPWTTQLFVKGEAGNRQDNLWSRIGDDEAKALVTMDFVPLKTPGVTEFGARFDIVVERTPQA